MNNETTTERKIRLLAGYSMGISCFSPAMNLYVIQKLHNIKNVSYLRMCWSVYPQQVGLRLIQVGIVTQIKEYLNPWVAFGVMGVLQGFIYGHANVNFSRQLFTNCNFKINFMFRGTIYAATRDVISQGIPFMLSNKISNCTILKRFLPNDIIRQWTSLIGCSIVSVYLSHPFHVCQTEMQTNQLSYKQSFLKAYRDHGLKFVWKGVESRIGLLIITNIFNEIFLKPAWK